MKSKKPIYKSIWFWLVIILIPILLFVGFYIWAYIAVSLGPMGTTGDCAHWDFLKSVDITVESPQQARELLIDLNLISLSTPIERFTKEQLNINNDIIYGFGTSGKFVSKKGDIYHLNMENCEG